MRDKNIAYITLFSICWKFSLSAHSVAMFLCSFASLVL